MPLTIETFSNIKGGNAFYKAVSHPVAARRAQALIARLTAAGSVALYDPVGLFSGLAEFYDFSSVNFCNAYVQNIEMLGQPLVGHAAQPVTGLPDSDAAIIFVAAFDAERTVEHIRHLVPKSGDIITLDDMRIEPAWLTNERAYLDPMNFATNFAFFRDQGGTHTRLVTANYWSGYGATGIILHVILFGADGAALAEWDLPVADAVETVTIDSAAVRARFNLGDFTGQIFIHAAGIRGHDIVKYALDVWNDAGTELSCTHDANAWPSDLYAGLPAPKDAEDVVLWLQNSHPEPIPAGEIGLNLMGSDRIVRLDETIPGYATRALSVSELLPQARWPQQIEIQAGKHFVRPRYEVTQGGRRRIAHANVERVDMTPDPEIAELGNLMGKGFILPAPVLPPDRWRSIALPTPMATCQQDLPLAMLLIDGSGREMARHSFGRLARNHESSLDAAAMIADAGTLPSGFGHLELIYDFAIDGAGGGDADGWLHALFRYEDRKTGHAAETSFGAHIFNSVLTYKGEPQSYTGHPPGLSTRLFLRLGVPPLDTMCHLIYPASTPWHGTSATQLILTGGNGQTIAERMIEIPCGGSHLWRYSETFDAAERKAAGDRAYVVIRDTTCRLFGYHGLLSAEGAFSLDHMFGF
jgi:hypothetical protein